MGLFELGATIQNKHTNDVRTIVKIEDVQYDGEKTVKVFTLDVDLSRWNASNIAQNWNVKPTKRDYLYGVDYKVAEPTEEDLRGEEE